MLKICGKSWRDIFGSSILGSSGRLNVGIFGRAIFGSSGSGMCGMSGRVRGGMAGRSGMPICGTSMAFNLSSISGIVSWVRAAGRVIFQGAASSLLSDGGRVGVEAFGADMVDLSDEGILFLLSCDVPGLAFRAML